jgi:hypothetical protein
VLINERREEKCVREGMSEKQELPSILTPKEPSNKSKDPAPLYGSREYWEQRYSGAIPVADRKTSTGKVQNDDDGPLASHAWYFTYGDR